MTGWKLLFVCTDRGQHSTATLGSIRRLPMGSDHGMELFLDDENARTTVDNPSRRGRKPETRSRANGDNTYRVPCPRCGRDRLLRRENVQKLVDAGLTQVDISTLP